MSDELRTKDNGHKGIVADEYDDFWRQKNSVDQQTVLARRVVAHLDRAIDLIDAPRNRRWMRRIAMPNEFRRIYHFHVRKAGGTSLNFGMLSMTGSEPSRLYEALARSPRGRIAHDRRVFVGWNKSLIEKGNYFYAFSHIPYHELDLRPATFTITSIREPISRILSHYRMLSFFRDNEIMHPCMQEEGAWLGRGLRDFLKNVPQEHLLRQVYMFSPSFNVDEAFETITQCSHFFLTEDFARAMNELSGKLGFSVPTVHVRRSPRSGEALDGSLKDELCERLGREIELYERLRVITDGPYSTPHPGGIS